MFPKYRNFTDRFGDRVHAPSGSYATNKDLNSFMKWGRDRSGEREKVRPNYKSRMSPL